MVSSPKVIVLKFVNLKHSTFVRLIFDNILVTYETFYYLKKKKTKRVAKFHIVKAHDEVKYPVFELFMQQMGFPKLRIQLMMKCL